MSTFEPEEWPTEASNGAVCTRNSCTISGGGTNWSNWSTLRRRLNPGETGKPSIVYSAVKARVPGELTSELSIEPDVLQLCVGPRKPLTPGASSIRYVMFP